MLVCVLALHTVPARAQSAADRTTARELALEGQAAFDRGDFATAADRFERANALVHAPTLLLALARAQVKLGKLVQAYESYNQIIREGLSKDASKVFKEAHQDARNEVEPVRVRLAWVTISVSGPQTPRVSIDGAAVPPAALGVRRAVNPGDHVARAEGDGYLPQEKPFSAAEGGSAELSFSLERAPAGATEPTPPAAGATAPAQGPPAPVVSDAGQPAPKRTLAYVALGVGATGLIVGSVTGIMALGKHSSLSEACPDGKCPEAEQSELDSYRTLGTISTIGFVVGVVGAGAGITLLVTAPKRTEPTATRLGLRVGAQSVSAWGTF